MLPKSLKVLIHLIIESKVELILLIGFGELARKQLFFFLSIKLILMIRNEQKVHAALKFVLIYFWYNNRLPTGPYQESPMLIKIFTAMVIKKLIISDDWTLSFVYIFLDFSCVNPRRKIFCVVDWVFVFRTRGFCPVFSSLKSKVFSILKAQPYNSIWSSSFNCTAVLPKKWIKSES